MFPRLPTSRQKECVVPHLFKAHIPTSVFCLFSYNHVVKNPENIPLKVLVCGLSLVHSSLTKATQIQSPTRLRTFSESSLDFWWGARLRTREDVSSRPPGLTLWKKMNPAHFASFRSISAGLKGQNPPVFEI